MDIMRAECSKVLEKSKIRDMFDMTKTIIRHKGMPDTSFATFRCASSPESIQGFHNDNGLVFIIDEASALEDSILNAILGALTQKNNILMMFGNPTRVGNAFFDAFNKQRKFYHTFTLSSIESPLVKPEYYESLEAKYGKDSNMYKIRVLGQFPTSSPDTLISTEIIEAACERELEIDEDLTSVTIGCDCARYGDDESSIYTRHDKIIKEEWLSKSNSIMELVGQINKVVHKYEDQGYTKFYIAVDDSGLGSGVTDRLKELQDENFYKHDVIIMPINNGSRPKERKKFFNKSMEMWYHMKDFLKTGSIPNDDDLIGQLSVRKFFLTSKDQLRLETKDQLKSRSISSPDRADGVILTLAPLIYQRTILTSSGTDIEDVPIETVKEKVEKFHASSFTDRMNFFKNNR